VSDDPYVYPDTDVLRKDDDDVSLVGVPVEATVELAALDLRLS
jgi:hypothetical protein